MTTDTKTPSTAEQITSPTDSQHHPDPDAIRKALDKRSFATLATTSLAGRPHVAGVLYEFVNNVLYINTIRSSRKARNIADNSNVAVCVPVRRLPVGPPSTIQFQAEGEVLALDSAEITALVKAGRLKSLTKHGELDIPDGCFLRVRFGPRVVTYGLGMSISKLVGDPLNAGGSAMLEHRA